MWSERARGSRVAGSCLLGHPAPERKFKLAEEKEDGRGNRVVVASIRISAWCDDSLSAVRTP